MPFLRASTLILLAASLALAESFHFTTIDDPVASAAGLSTSAVGINNVGKIVGGYAKAKGPGDICAFSYNRGVFTTLDVPCTNLTIAVGINDRDQISGFDPPHGFLYAGGVLTTLNYPTPTTFTSAEGINDGGEIVGNYFDNTGEHGFLYASGTFATIDDPKATAGSGANGINNWGQIVGVYGDSAGTHAYLYFHGTFTTIDDPDSAVNTGASGINDWGDIVGTYRDATNTPHGFLYSHGVFTTVDDPKGTKGTILFGINDWGQMVGAYFDANNVSHGLLAETRIEALSDDSGQEH